MTETLYSRVGFRRWLERIAQDQPPGPSEQPTAEDAQAFLGYHDNLSRRVRDLEAHAQTTHSELAKFAGDDFSTADSETILRALGDEIRSLRSAQNIRSSELSLKLVRLRSELADEKQKLESVLRYAYRLRRLVQSIYASIPLPKPFAEQIETLLRAGGIDLTPNGPSAANKDQTAVQNHV